MTERVEPIWFILEKIQKDIDRIDEKQDSQLVTSTRLITQVDAVSTKVLELNKLLTVDNGRPSIVSKLNNLAQDVTETKTLISKLHEELAIVQHHVGIKTPKEVSIERWKTVGKVGVATAAVIPGILSFIHEFLI